MISNDIERLEKYCIQYRQYTVIHQRLAVCAMCKDKAAFDNQTPFGYDTQTDSYTYPDYDTLACRAGFDTYCTYPSMAGVSIPKTDEVIRAAAVIEGFLLENPSQRKEVKPLLEFLKDSVVADEVKPHISTINDLIKEKPKVSAFGVFDSVLFGDKRELAVMLFNVLKQHCIIASTTLLNDWLYVCGFTSSKAVTGAIFKPIDYKGRTLVGLAYLIETFFGRQNNKWSVGACCFTINGRVITSRQLSKASEKHWSANADKVRIDNAKIEFDSQKTRY